MTSCKSPSPRHGTALSHECPCGQNASAPPSATSTEPDRIDGNQTVGSAVLILILIAVGVGFLGPYRKLRIRGSATGARGQESLPRILGAVATALLPGLLALILLLPGAMAQTHVPQDWELLPSGLQTGDSFRLLFLSSSTRDGTSADIADYNSFIQGRATAGHSAIRLYGSQFTAVASTRSTDARDNTSTTGTGVPIYWLDGSKLADNYADFYDGDWDDEVNLKNENGNSRSSIAVYTGSKDDGTASSVAGSSRALGQTAVRVGRLNSEAGPIDGNSNSARTDQRPFYGLSPVFTVRGEISDRSLLVPSGYEPGDTFRLLFLSSTRRSLSDGNIVKYNEFVQGLAANGHRDIRTLSSSFRVVGSTAVSDARDNTGTTGAGVPIYWLNGNKVADDYADFYDGSWDDEANPRNESGAEGFDITNVNYYPATGSNHDGTKKSDGTNSRALGSSLVAVARPSVDGPLSSSRTTNGVNQRPLYGLSPVLLVRHTPPALDSGHFVSMDGRSVQLFFDEDLDGSALPPLSAYSVTADGVDVSVNGHSVGFESNFKRLRLTLSGAVLDDATVTVSYTDPTFANDSGALQDEDGNDVASFSALAIANRSVVVLTVPGAPIRLTATAMGRDRIDLTWSPPTDTGGTPITGYKIEVSTDGSSGWSDLVADTGSTATTYSHPGLAPGDTRHYRVSAINSVGTGGASSTASATTDADPPGAPTGLTATAMGRDRIDLTWSPPTDTGGPPITGYKIEVSTDGGSGWSDLVADTGSTATTYSHPGLAPGVTRHYRVSAINSVGTGGASSTASATTDVAPPGAPTGFTATADGQTEIDLSWSAPSDTGGAPISGYRIEVSTDGGLSWSDLVANTGTSAASFSDTGLAPGTTRHYRVSAINSAGAGPPSNEDGATTGQPDPLTAHFDLIPASHDALSTFEIRILFSEGISIAAADFRDNALQVTSGNVTQARRSGGRNDLWRIDIEPDSDADVTIVLPANRPCTQAGAICTSDDRPLTNRLDGTVAGPDTAEVSIATGPSPVTEGTAATFTVTRTGGIGSSLDVGVSVTEVGSFLDGTPPSAVHIPSGATEAILAVPTYDDGDDESNGFVTVALQAGTGYVIRSDAASATVTVRDDDEGRDRSGTLQGPSTPPQVALWTDRPGYRVGERIRLYRTVIPHDDRGRYRTFVYLERSGSDERRYLAPLSAAGELHADPVDDRGMPAHLTLARSLVAADMALAWEGDAPSPGLWQFVMELRPEAEPDSEDEQDSDDEPPEPRWAWAKFTVANGTQALNRRGFDREVRTDLTLRSDTLYSILDQLFVHDGATLTIEPGTVVRAWGRNAVIIVERGGRIVAEGTREAPVVLTCLAPVGQREAGCWGGLRILGKAPVTRLEGVAAGVLPAERPVYGGTDEEDSSGSLRYVRVEFAGAGGDPEAPAAAIGLYGAGSGTVLDHVQARTSIGDGFAFHGGDATCDHCVASGSGNAGLSWNRGWRGGASHLYVQHGAGGFDGLAGGNDEQGHDLEPRSLPTLSNVTLIHAHPYGDRERDAVGLRLSTGSGVAVRDVLVTRFGRGAIDARGRSALLFTEGESSVTGALLHLNGTRPGGGQVRGDMLAEVEFTDPNPKLRDVRDFANPDPRPKAESPALPDEGEGYIGAFGEEDNWLEEWTVLGPESVYDTRERDEEEN